ncbi:ScbA/BarX family gamma-butyrolactone biosynthesis protein [Streptacidiphilus jiangxiensis]|uniref:A-factor biosynthesis hotdog domain-containing protein n=1 Tax=Streptacidiphilus jiangxiensis TaxID=235985 RepID=A0A1H7KGZ1_STRJI|nr:ScbA/BarX family gamma-butyrolactone biosynthesis protein [Streptacidiphilus jiangxiensis]SEK86059.1 A-factor biosynthesis hotdog domain-containing protein [Streptacidiphilus jiangxiensis]
MSPSLTASASSLAELTHRIEQVEVLPTDWIRLGGDRYLISARWLHPFFVPVHGYSFDPLLVVESMRQSSILVSHVGFGVPTDHRFVMNSMSFAAEQGALSGAERGCTETGGDAVIEVHCTDVLHRGRQLAGLRTEVQVRFGGRLVATGAGNIGFVRPSVYERLRGHCPLSTDAAVRTAPLPTPLDPWLVGRASEEDVLLAPSGQQDCWQLRCDPTHPVLFHRPSDHVPGMMLLEAARQAAHAATVSSRPFVPLGGGLKFHRYAELDQPVWIQAYAVDLGRDGCSVVVRGRQNDTLVFEGVLAAGADA